MPHLACLLDRLLRYIHRHVSRYAPLDVPCRRTQIQRNLVELFITMTLTRKISVRINTIPRPVTLFRILDWRLLATTETDHSLDIAGGKPAAIFRITGALPYIGNTLPGQIPHIALLFPVRAA